MNTFRVIYAKPTQVSVASASSVRQQPERDMNKTVTPSTATEREEKLKHDVQQVQLVRQ